MFAPRNAFQRAGQQLRSTPVRSTIQRRLNSSDSKLPSWAADNAFNREREAVKHHAASTKSLWLKLSIFGIPPVLIGGAYNAWTLWDEHWQHWEHMAPLEERVEYPYQNIRVKNFPWGDGDKTIFWNSSVNYHNKDKAT
ncbi:putative cytochrome c oxidase subunit VIa [Aspergillus ellipticus CBS 707.79]|uniref:Cytochrome c oxidase subunit n=1 Tax=Aspergillus ellipticus CBS 707.79 TaxID=1448320 RepID=A0A319EDB6_9EURO|nr:putative cytochrome c oxidase subunit VIa [Aspergillus ellipticus CBS 707.79]